jgi:membrane-bound lytic murein transglycosylase D
MKKRIVVRLYLLFAVLCAQTLTAQNRGHVKIEEADDKNDQVIEMLDSLVNIKYISRISLKKYPVTRNNFQPSDIPTYSDDILRQRLAKLQSPISLAFNEQVKRYIELYVNRRRELSSITLGLSRLYFPLFEQVLDMYGLPLELKYLAVVESALNPLAVSKMGATGLWQFMYNTGKIYNLEINSYIDERRDVYKSTVAACQYLKEMYSIYKDWLLVIASYNCGPGNVNKAIIRSGGKTNFWEIAKYLPKETRGYVPAFIAVNYMMNYSAEHNIPIIPTVLSYLELDTITVTQKLSLSDVGPAIGVSSDLIRFLNPIYKRSFIPKSYDKPFVLILPANKVSTFLANSESLYRNPTDNPQPVYSGGNPLLVRKAPAVQVVQAVQTSAPQQTVLPKEIRKVHIVKKGEDADALTQRYECTIAELKKWNHMKTMKLRAGQRVIIYLSSDTQNRLMTYAEKESKTIPVVDNPEAKVKYVYYVVQKGDTLWKIAQKYEGVTVEQLKQINKLRSTSELKPGTRIKVVLTT